MQIQLSAVCKLLLFAVFLAGVGCDPDDRRDEVFTYNVAIKNDSSVPVTIYGYRLYDVATGNKLQEPLLITNLRIESKSRDKDNFFILPSRIEGTAFIYPGFENNVDSIVVKFNGLNRGYITYLEEKKPNKSLWITNKSSLFEIAYNDLLMENKTFFYSISQKNYEDALALE